ncbi:MAG: Y-family DNA polymerase, partial [Solirubrobacteraceae bacterium]
LCPHAVFVDGHYSRYAAVSAELRRVLVSFTPLVEPIGLDEAFLDVRGAARLLGDPAEIAHAIRRRVREELHLACSVGVGCTKMIAKLASRAAKPVARREGPQAGRGVVLVAAGEEQRFLRPMPVEQLWGVGPATTSRLHALGVATIGDLAEITEAALVHAVGASHGAQLAALARGEDADPVVPDRPAKSIGHEETFAEDVTDPSALVARSLHMCESVAVYLRAEEKAARTVSVKVKLADFTLVTRAHTLADAIDTGGAIGAVAAALIAAIDLPIGARLLGVSVSGLEPSAGGRQLRFDLDTASGAGLGGQAFEAARRRDQWDAVTAAVDAIRRRFGVSSVGTVSMVGPAGIAVPARRESPWGPQAGPEASSTPAG